MKTMKKLQVAVAAASLFAVTGGALAASVSQSGLTIAREAVSHNASSTQTLRAPTVTFNFDNGPAANGSSTQDFNVTLKLGPVNTAKWAAATANYKTVAAFRRNNANAVVPVLPASAVVPPLKVALVLLGVDVVAADASEQTFRYKFRLVNNTANSIGIGDLQLNFNGQNPGDGLGDFATGLTGVGQELNAVVVAAVAGDYQRVKNLQTIVSAPKAPVAAGAGTTGGAADECGDPTTSVTVTARNYIGSGDGVEGESANPGANITNNGYIQFTTALRAQIQKLDGVTFDRNTDPLQGNKKFVQLDNGAPILGTETVMALGTVKFSNRSVDAWDLEQTGAYYKYGANDLVAGISKVGDVDVSSLRLDVLANNGFESGVKFRLSRTPVCDVGTPWTSPTSVAPDGKSLNVSFARADLALADAFGVGSSISDTAGSGVVGAPWNVAVSITDQAFVCMQVSGSNLIPQSKYSGYVTVVKAPEDAEEQDNKSCLGNLNGLGGGIKIDVRNYMEFAPGSEWESYVRVINNSETVTADVFAQYIRADGTYGKWVKLFDLPARAARFISGTEINAAMAATGTNSTAGGADQGYNNGVAAGYAGSNARLRISSEAASTLRVQNYIYNNTTKLLSEMSGAQGADFVNVEASKRDHIDQDAQTGIQK